MFIIFSLSLWWLNSLVVPVGSRNSQLKSRGIPWWYSKAQPNSQLKLSRIFLLCKYSSCVHLKNNTVVINSLVGVLMSFFMVFTIHEFFDFCCRLSLPLSVFAISWPLSRDWNWFSLCLLCTVFLGIVSLGLLRFNEEVLTVDLDWYEMVVSMFFCFLWIFR